METKKTVELSLETLMMRILSELDESWQFMERIYVTGNIQQNPGIFVHSSSVQIRLHSYHQPSTVLTCFLNDIEQSLT